jgi:hypothetical protein
LWDFHRVLGRLVISHYVAPLIFGTKNTLTSDFFGSKDMHKFRSFKITQLLVASSTTVEVGDFEETSRIGKRNEETLFQ